MMSDFAQDWALPRQSVIREICAEVRTRLATVPDRTSMSEDRLRDAVETQVSAILSLPAWADARSDGRLRDAVLNDLLGFGPLQDLLSDRTVSEIMVNGASTIFVESGGMLRRTARAFESDDQLLAVVDRMLHSSGRRVDQASPMVDARLPDGSRLNVILPPLSVDGPSVTIRKFLTGDLTVDHLVDRGSLSHEAAEFLKGAVATKCNILVSGGTGTGKTTILNILSSFIGRTERVVTIEDAVELTLAMPNLVRLETRPPNTEGAGEVDIRDLVRNSLRMRPDRIVVGEVRGGETIDMLQAMNTGHEGSLSTVHANSPRDALRRLETMVLLGGTELPLRAVREQVAAAIDLVVHLARDARGRRFVSRISEIGAMEGELITMADLFARELDSGAVDGDLPPLASTGLASHRMGRRVGAAR